MPLQYFTNTVDTSAVFPDISNSWAVRIHSQALHYLEEQFGLDVSGWRYHICRDPMAQKIRVWQITFTRANGAKVVLSDVESNTLAQVIRWGLEKTPELMNV